MGRLAGAVRPGHRAGPAVGPASGRSPGDPHLGQRRPQPALPDPALPPGPRAFAGVGPGDLHHRGGATTASSSGSRRAAARWCSRRSTPSGSTRRPSRSRSPSPRSSPRSPTNKGIDRVLDAWPLVTAAVPEARLVVAGRGPLEGLVRERAATDPSIEFLGSLPGDGVAELLRTVAVFVTAPPPRGCGTSSSAWPTWRRWPAACRWSPRSAAPTTRPCWRRASGFPMTPGRWPRAWCTSWATPACAASSARCARWWSTASSAPSSSPPCARLRRRVA